MGPHQVLCLVVASLIIGFVAGAVWMDHLWFTRQRRG